MTTEKIKTPSAAALFLRRRDTWIREVLERDQIPLMARVVGVHLAMYMNAKSQEAYPSIDHMAKRLGKSARHIQRGMIELERAGLLTVSRKKREVNYYYLKLPSDPE